MSSNGFPMPKNVFKGVNSDGTTFRVEEWDYGDLATLEVIPAIFMCIFAFAMASIAAPILTILLLVYVGLEGRFRYLFTALLSGYVLYDFYHGWLCLISTNFIFSDKYVSYIMIANAITFGVSMLMFVFHNMIYSFTYEPVSGYTEEQYNRLSNGEKSRINDKIQKRLEKVAYIIWIVIILSLGTSMYIDYANKGWVSRNTEISE